MKQHKFAWMLALILALSLMMLCSGCGDSNTGNGHGDDLDEPEITLEYLSTEFAEQILRDGGEEILGTIQIREMSEDSYSLTVNSMVIVESSITDEGYYIADKNLSTTVPLDSDAHATYIKDSDKGPQIMDLKEFIKTVQEDASSGADVETGNEKLYRVYIIGGNALMILAEELPNP